MGKLNDHTIHSIVKEYQRGSSASKLATKYSVDSKTILYHLHKNTLVRKQGGQSKYTLNEVAFKTLTKDSAYWIGFLLADGCIYSSGSSPVPRIQLRLQQKDLGHIMKFKHFLSAGNPIHTVKIPPHYIKGKYVGAQTIPTFTVSSVKLANDLAKYGVVPRKTFTAKIYPRLSYNVDFWRGVVDGDGSIVTEANTTCRGIRHTPALCLYGTFNVVKQFIKFVKRYFPQSLSLPSKHGKIYMVKFSYNMANKIIKVLYGNASVSLDRKLNRANFIMSRPGLKPPLY